MHVSTTLDSPLGKAAVKAKSITDSEEESVAADKSFSSKDKSVRRGGGGGREGDKREIWYSKQMMSHDLILSLPHYSPPLPSIPFSTPLHSPPLPSILFSPSLPFPSPVWCTPSPSTRWWGRRPECKPSLSGETGSSGICSW